MSNLIRRETANGQPHRTQAIPVCEIFLLVFDFIVWNFICFVGHQAGLSSLSVPESVLLLVMCSALANDYLEDVCCRAYVAFNGAVPFGGTPSYLRTYRGFLFKNIPRITTAQIRYDQSFLFFSLGSHTGFHVL